MNICWEISKTIHYFMSDTFNTKFEQFIQIVVIQTSAMSIENGFYYFGSEPKLVRNVPFSISFCQQFTFWTQPTRLASILISNAILMEWAITFRTSNFIIAQSMALPTKSVPFAFRHCLQELQKIYWTNTNLIRVN